MDNQDLQRILIDDYPAGKSDNFNIGFFSKPYIVNDGPLKGYVLKRYKPLADLNQCQKVKELHEEYVKTLIKTGIKIPETRLVILHQPGKNAIVIVQPAFKKHELVRDSMIEGSMQLCVRHLKGILNDTINFIKAKTHAQLALGFHPTLRNYACRNNDYYYFDTFPPMTGMTRKELNSLIIDFAPYKISKWVKPLAMPFMNRVSGEYFQYDKMLTGIVGSACRLRPEYAGELLDSAKQTITEGDLDKDLQNRVLKALEKPPRLSKLWTITRKLLGKEGKPNI